MFQDLSIDPSIFDGVTLYRGRGCDRCKNSGYSGRMAIIEAMTITDEIRKLIIARANTREMGKIAIGQGMRTLRMVALDRVREGISTLEQVLRADRRPIELGGRRSAGSCRRSAGKPHRRSGRANFLLQARPPVPPSPMLELEEALARILAAIPSPTVESISLSDASGRVLAEQIASPIDLPLFDNSAMDGYAVRAADVASARPESPVRLRLIGKAAAGTTFTGEVTAGTCVRLFTGSPLPRGADAVVMQEDTRVEAKAADEVLFLEPAKPGENVRRQRGRREARGDAGRSRAKC